MPVRGQTSGFTMMEALMTIGIAAMLLAVFTALLTVTIVLRRAQNGLVAANFIQEELDTLRTLPFAELLTRTDGNFLGVAMTRGPWKVAADATAPSSPNAYVMESAQSAVIEETGLAVLPGNYREDFTFSAKIKVMPSPPAGWGAGIAFRYRDAENHYRFRFSSGGIALDRVLQGTKTTIWTQSATYNADTWYTLEVVAAGANLTLKKNGATLATVIDGSFTRGDLALMAINGALIHADDAAVTAGATTTWNFNAEAVNAVPTDWQRMSVANLPSGVGKLTIANYLGNTNVKNVTAKVQWTELGIMRTASSATLIAK
ncbi:hypothetical protein HY633_02455 [Candidatus Uhrbacteria bacterium]|nr:hypothetical protein [Candidatus Uhrbacteria bacterium]